MKLIARLKFQFDIGLSFMTILNFSFVVLAASDKITTLTHIPARILFILIVPTSIFLVWLFGFMADRLGFFKAYQAEINKRNKMLNDIQDSINKV